MAAEWRLFIDQTGGHWKVFGSTHTELNFPRDEQSEPRDREGWQRLVLQGEPTRKTRKTRKLLSCDGCSVMFCAGVGRFQGG